MNEQTENERCSIELPKYQCHKQVWALKIKDINRYEFLTDPITKTKPADHATIFPENKQYMPFEVDEAYLKKHNPQIGGYYVVYPDGYKSFSPADAFEDGYTLIK